MKANVNAEAQGDAWGQAMTSELPATVSTGLALLWTSPGGH